MQQTQQKDLVQRSFLVTTIVVFVILVVLLLLFAINVWLLVFAGILLATFFNGLTSLIERKTKWKHWISKTLAVALTIALAGGAFWLMGAKVAAEAKQMSEQVPKMLQQVEQKMQSSPIGKKIVESVKKSGGSGSTGKFFSTTFGVLGDIFSIFFLAMFFTVSPNTYKKGVVMLLPASAKQQGALLLDKLGEALRKWLKGTLFSMLVVFILTSLGLVSLGVKLWFVLALIAGILNAIPNIGPIIAMIPAVLMNMGEGTTTIWLIIGLYMLVQNLESNIITPWVQNKLLELPAALILIAQLIMGALTGSWGLILATPLLVVIMVTVNELYVSRQPAPTGGGGKKKKDED